MAIINKDVVPFSSFIANDMEKGYVLPIYAVTYVENYWPRNCRQYARYDMTRSYISLNNIAQSTLPVFGDDIPVLLDEEPPLHLREHWKKWLSCFPSPVIKRIQEGLADDLPIMVYFPIEMIPAEKHFINPDVLYKLHLKSTIPDIGVSCPKHYQEDDTIIFPCFVKVDQSSGGMGVTQAHDQEELSEILRKFREDDGWTGEIVVQEAIKDIIESLTFNFYLNKSGDVFWLGTSVGNQTIYWSGSTINWEKQDYYYNLVNEEFTKPIAQYLTSHGYFGFVNYEVLVTKNGSYLHDLNPRTSSSIATKTAAKFMAGSGFSHVVEIPGFTLQSTVEEAVDCANKINTSSDSERVVIMAANDVGDGCFADLAVFAKDEKSAEALRDNIINHIYIC